MCWNTDLIYIHYRPVAENRILLGGSTPWVYYLPEIYHSSKIIELSISDLKNNFPAIKDVKFTHYWAGLIDVTKDLMPIADYDKHNTSIQYSMACAGLNWAAYCGDYLARRIVDTKTEDLTEFLGADRKFFISSGLQKILGKRVSFALSHLKKLMG
jgi:glycine/D-amino acid oxidase-like deaminating enzyme